MFKTIRNAWKMPELRRKILFTIFALLIFRLGAAIPVPYINTECLQTYLTRRRGTIFGLINAMSGSAFSMATLFALSIQPYINSLHHHPAAHRGHPGPGAAGQGGRRGGPEEDRVHHPVHHRGHRPAPGLWLLHPDQQLRPGDRRGRIWAAIVIIVSFTAGSAFLMWLGEQITEFGVGNGISIILFAGIVSRVPQHDQDPGHWRAQLERRPGHLRLDGVSAGPATPIMDPGMIAVLLVVGMLALVVLIVFITNSERRLPVQYAKRVVGRKMYGGQSTHIPIKVNMSGVLPIIFAQSIAMIPATIGMFCRLDPAGRHGVAPS